QVEPGSPGSRLRRAQLRVRNQCPSLGHLLLRGVELILRRRRAMAGQAMVEFAMVAPLFLLLVLATIAFGGYFASRLGVEEATRAGARAAAVQDYSSYSGTAITRAISAQRGLATLTTNQDCTWQGTTLDPNQYPPFTFSGSGCVGIWYF